MAYEILPTDVLIIVDPQNDFCPGGALAVAGGDEIMGDINDLTKAFKRKGATVVISQDWHPRDHKSFASNHEGAEPFGLTDMPYGVQVLWPDHCVQGSEGAAFHPHIMDGAFNDASAIIRKGMNPEVDSYSAFIDNDKATDTGLSGYLHTQKVRRVFVVGLAYDFCVGYTALDAVANQFDAVVVRDLTRAIDMPNENGGTVAEIEARFRDYGVEVITFSDITQ